MKKFQRVLAALMAVLVISTTAYSYAVPVQAAGAGAVVAGDTLLELLAAFLATMALSYGGSLLDSTEFDYDIMTSSFCLNHTQWLYSYTSELVDAGYMAESALDYLSEDISPEDVDALLAMPCAGILVNDTLVDFVTSDQLYRKEGEKDFISHVDEIVDQEFYFTNSQLPEFIYIGYNNSLIPGVAVLDNYDTSVSHLQYYSDDISSYRDIQVPRQNADRWEGETIEAACYIQYGYATYVYAGSSYYMYDPGSYLQGTGIVTTLNSYVFGGNACIVNSTSYLEKTSAIVDHPIYVSPVVGQPALLGYNNKYYLIYANGVVSDGVVSTAPSGVVTDDDALNSVDSIVGGVGFGAYLALLLNSLRGIEDSDTGAGSGTGTGTVTQTKNLNLSKEAIDQISDLVNEYYQTTVQNYYQDTSYIDGDTYIENITNIYEQAAVDYPAIEIPDIAIDDTGILAGIRAIPGQILDGIKSLFIPDVAVMQGYVGSILDHFSWMREPWDFFRSLIDMIFVDNNDPPVIYIDLSQAESSYIYGGKTVLIDFAFWQRYKPLADTIIVGFCYIWFAFWFFRNLPEILSGGSPVPVFRSSERSAARIHDAVLKSDPEYGRVKVDAVTSTALKNNNYSGGLSAHHNIKDDQMRPKS